MHWARRSSGPVWLQWRFPRGAGETAAGAASAQREKARKGGGIDQSGARSWISGRQGPLTGYNVFSLDFTGGALDRDWDAGLFSHRRCSGLAMAPVWRVGDVARIVASGLWTGLGCVVSREELLDEERAGLRLTQRLTKGCAIHREV